MSSYTHIPRIYICSPYTAVASRREARRIAIRALEEADEFFDSKGLAVELFSPVLANSVQYADRSYDEIMKICFMQIDTCGEIFIPSAKTCDISLIAGSKGIGLEIDYATARGYKIHNCEALRREKFLQNLKGKSK